MSTLDSTAPGSWAMLTSDGKYRWLLGRQWDFAAPVPLTCAFVMLNPSTADAEQDDPTIRRCIGFAKTWGFGALVVANAYGLRSTDPKALRRTGDPVGPANDTTISACVSAPHVCLVVAAWGAHITNQREREMVKLVSEHRNIHVLGLTKDGHPKHPLYIKGDTTPTLWRAKGGGA